MPSFAVVDEGTYDTTKISLISLSSIAAIRWPKNNFYSKLRYLNHLNNSNMQENA